MKIQCMSCVAEIREVQKDLAFGEGDTVETVLIGCSAGFRQRAMNSSAYKAFATVFVFQITADCMSFNRLGKDAGKQNGKKYRKYNSFYVQIVPQGRYLINRRF